MSTFDEIRRLTNALAKDISDLTGVRFPIVLNVIQYARCLGSVANPEVIEELVFIAQMGLRFGITSMYHVKLMFEATRVRDTNFVRVDDYAKLICIFFSKNLDVKIDFVFSVYDFYHDNQICFNEMSALLRTAFLASNEDDAMEQMKDLIEIVLFEFDADGDRQISLEEFRALVRQNILYIQLLGQVLPHKEFCDSFLDLVKNKTPLAVREYFTHERTDCLSEPPLPKKKETFYPIILDLP